MTDEKPPNPIVSSRYSEVAVAAALHALEPGQKVRVEVGTGDAYVVYVNSTEPGKVYLDPPADDDIHEDYVAGYKIRPSLYGIIRDPETDERLDSRFGTITGLVTVEH